MQLRYNKSNWVMEYPVYKRSAQFFITNRCNKNCEACFYAKFRCNKDMDFDFYKRWVSYQKEFGIDKVILIGGEPTLHQDLISMILYNQSLGLDTTIYTHGEFLKSMESDFNGLDLSNVSIRVGVLGFRNHEKQLWKVKTTLPITVVFMYRQDNITEIEPIIRYSASELNCQGLMVSSIRDIATTNSFWADTSETIPNEIYAAYVQRLLDEGLLDLYRNGIKRFHICRRGVIDPPKNSFEVTNCRFINYHVDGTTTICPFDISLGIRDGQKDWIPGNRVCNKNHVCLLQKLILKAV